MDTNSRVASSFIKDVWNAGDPSAADKYLAPGYIDHAYEPKNKSGLIAMITLLATAFPDQRSIIEDSVSEDDRVMMRLRLTGTHTGTFRSKEATGNKIDVRVVRWFRLADGKILEHWALLDTLSLFRQIEILPKI